MREPRESLPLFFFPPEKKGGKGKFVSISLLRNLHEQKKDWMDGWMDGGDGGGRAQGAV